jgi:hypothetical protein
MTTDPAMQARLSKLVYRQCMMAWTRLREICHCRSSEPMVRPREAEYHHEIGSASMRASASDELARAVTMARYTVGWIGQDVIYAISVWGRCKGRAGTHWLAI